MTCPTHCQAVASPVRIPIEAMLCYTDYTEKQNILCRYQQKLWINKAVFFLTFILFLISEPYSKEKPAFNHNPFHISYAVNGSHCGVYGTQGVTGGLGADLAHLRVALGAYFPSLPLRYSICMTFGLCLQGPFRL